MGIKALAVPDMDSVYSSPKRKKRLIPPCPLPGSPPPSSSRSLPPLSSSQHKTALPTTRCCPVSSLCEKKCPPKTACVRRFPVLSVLQRGRPLPLQSPQPRVQLRGKGIRLLRRRRQQLPGKGGRTSQSVKTRRFMHRIMHRAHDTTLNASFPSRFSTFAFPSLTTLATSPRPPTGPSSAATGPSSTSRTSSATTHR